VWWLMTNPDGVVMALAALSWLVGGSFSSVLCW